uniref:Uncharacterized protein n=1 Tax=Electrophorus electricus TaxID=8005 RepID=A0AAY5EDR5_ELEEL
MKLLLFLGLATVALCELKNPDSADMVTVGMDVDIHIPASHADMAFIMLQQSDMKYK